MTGRSKHVGVGDIFHDGGSGGPSLWVRNVSDEPPHVPVLGEFTEQGVPSYQRKKSAVALGRNLGVTPLEKADGGRNVGGGFGGGGGICLEEE